MIAAAEPAPIPDPREAPPGGDVGSLDDVRARPVEPSNHRHPVLAASFVSGSFLLLPVALIVLGGFVETGLTERPVRTLACLAAVAAGYVGLARFAFRRHTA